ncbi:MAG: DHH family phosphoesterase [Haloarculaceae archaeon]
MSSFLVLGCGGVGQSLVGDLAERRGDLLVVSADEHRADTLRNDGVHVETGDPTDGATIRSLDIEPEVVLVAGTDPERNLAAARAARTSLPDASLVAYAGWDADDGTRTALTSVADEVIDPARAVTDHLLERVGDPGVRARQLQRVFREIGGPLAIVTHDNPDPDAIASAVALARIAERTGCDPEVCYYGDITHQENRAFVNLLEYDLVRLDAETDLETYDGVALVDHSRPGVNDQLPADLDVDVVIDHHPPRAPIEARFVDLRSEVGATSTMLVEYLRQFDPELEPDVATGLLFGIRVDTREFRREVSVEDFEAAAHLLPYADLDTLARIDDPSVSTETLETLGRAIGNRQRHGSVLLSGVGRIGERDALAQAADQLLDLEDINAVLVYGVMEGTVYASARARGTDIDLGETMRDAFGQIGSAGGHADMAGAQIALGVLDAIDEGDESLQEILDAVVAERFLDALESRSNRLLGGVYADAEFGTTGEPPGPDAG